MSYEHYNIEDFLADEGFRTWVLSPDDNGDVFWTHWMETHPTQKATILSAREVLLSLKYKEAEQVSESERSELLKSILQHQEPSDESKTRFVSNRVLAIAASIVLLIAVGGITISTLMVQDDEPVVKVIEPIFESQTKTKLGSLEIEPKGKSMRAFVNDFLKEKLDNYLHRNPDTAEILEKKIKRSEKERKELAGIRKIARERSKKASLHNKKLRDCRVHFTDLKDERHEETTLFITEGDSASGSITKSRNVNTQAVFSLRGKPLNSFGLTKKVVYENEEFNLIQAALDIEDEMDSLRYNRIVIATDADVDGMHIRMLLLTFFLRFFPDLVKRNHVYVLQTPLFRVRNKKKTIYCYSSEERNNAMDELGKNPEITRFKGLGEISPDEFKHFIGEDIRLEPVILNKEASIDSILSYFMGKNTPQRQEFIIENLRVEKDPLSEDEDINQLNTAS